MDETKFIEDGKKELASQFFSLLSNKYKEREPTESEMDYFKKSQHVAGYAAEDGQVVLNPFASVYANQELAPLAKESVKRNERLRLYLRDQNISPDFPIAPHQIQMFKRYAPEYLNNPTAMRQTILGRLASGDPSASPYLPEQQDALLSIMQNGIK